jgi:hypothetical protein
MFTLEYRAAVCVCVLELFNTVTLYLLRFVLAQHQSPITYYTIRRSTT